MADGDVKKFSIRKTEADYYSFPIVRPTGWDGGGGGGSFAGGCTDPEYYFRWVPVYTGLSPSMVVSIEVEGGVSPFDWSVVGAGFSVAYPTTTGRTNLLYSDETVEIGDSAVITVVDYCEEEVEGNVVVTTDDEADVCDNCAGVSIGYESLEVSPENVQTIAVDGAIEGVTYYWRLLGEGSISAGFGNSISYTAGDMAEEAGILLLYAGVYSQVTLCDTLTITTEADWSTPAEDEFWFRVIRADGTIGEPDNFVYISIDFYDSTHAWVGNIMFVHWDLADPAEWWLDWADIVDEETVWDSEHKIFKYPGPPGDEPLGYNVTVSAYEADDDIWTCVDTHYPNYYKGADMYLAENRIFSGGEIYNCLLHCYRKVITMPIPAYNTVSLQYNNPFGDWETSWDLLVAALPARNTVAAPVDYYYSTDELVLTRSLIYYYSTGIKYTESVLRYYLRSNGVCLNYQMKKVDGDKDCILDQYYGSVMSTQATAHFLGDLIDFEGDYDNDDPVEEEFIYEAPGMTAEYDDDTHVLSVSGTMLSGVKEITMTATLIDYFEDMECLDIYGSHPYTRECYPWILTGWEYTPLGGYKHYGSFNTLFTNNTDVY